MEIKINGEVAETHQNLIEIYERLYKMGDEMPDSLVDGWDECLLTFKMLFLKMPLINYHVENRNLRVQLEKYASAKDHITKLTKRVTDLKAENKQLRKQLGLI